MENPVLVEVTRGALVESAHRGAFAIFSSSSGLLASAGDISRPVFARSAIKLVQALPLIETGAADRFGFGASEIALACGSHVGSPRHVAVARSMLDRLGQPLSCLACGPSEPIGSKAARALAESGGQPTTLHHTCSGKHLGFIAAARALDVSVDGYGDPGHPVQQRVKSALMELTGETISQSCCGTDGCAVPTYAMPLQSLARLFARIAARQTLAPARRQSLDQILAACWTKPDLVAGPGRADTIVMAALPGRLYLKTGAEGVYCGALTELGVGFALKIDDGAQRASAAAVMPLIERLIPDARGLVSRSVLRTPTGRQVGTIRTSSDYETILRSLNVG
jgi:L-asparaginase II